MILKGAKRSLIIIKIFVLIGAITAVWRASGTVSFIVYYGIKYMNPSYFIVSAFILSSIVSFLLGTCFGTVGTVGIVLMIMAKSGGVNIDVLAGAVIAGAYFGDRCSPMSSSANLVASITDTKLYTNIKNMLYTSVAPMLIATIAYTILSLYNPLSVNGDNIGSEILKLFNIDFVVILPAVVILVLTFFRVDVKISMLVSIISGIVIAVIYQQETIADVGRYLIAGYSSNADSFFVDIIKGGGLLSMLKVSLIVLVSSAYSGIFEGTNTFKELEVYIEGFKKRHGMFLTTVVVSIATASFGCTQALAIMLTNQLVGKMYQRDGRSKYELALDIEDTAVILAPLIPWNIGGAVPAATLTASMGFIPFAFYMYLLPITSYIAKRLKLISFEDMKKGTALSESE